MFLLFEKNFFCLDEMHSICQHFSGYTRGDHAEANAKHQEGGRKNVPISRLLCISCFILLRVKFSFLQTYLVVRDKKSRLPGLLLVRVKKFLKIFKHALPLENFQEFFSFTFYPARRRMPTIEPPLPFGSRA